MTTNKQIVTAIKKSLSKIDFSKIQEKCTNEAQTRLYLIEPIIQVLGYSSFDDMLTEINAGWGAKNDRADIGLLVKDKKNPEIIVECKALGKKLTDKEASQLNGYFINTKNSKIGILTNGMDWRFYSVNNATKSQNLFEIPFLVLDFSEINDELIEQLSKFHRNFLATNLNELLEETQEFYFMQGFDTAFASELFEPSDEFIKAIFNRMDGKKLTDNIKSKLKSLVNSNSIQSALLKVIDEESKSGNMVITTAEELKIYHTVKTILVHNKKIDADRITYRDQKNSFNVLVDDNNKKIVCKIISAKNKYTIEINGDKFDYIGIDSIVKMKKQLLESALSHIE
jgi:hypothetical protein